MPKRKSNDNTPSNRPFLHLGAHESVAGGVDKAFERIEKVGGRALQIFTKNRARWKSKPLEQAEIERFRNQAETFGSQWLLSHASYLINLASPDESLRRKSVEAMQEELARAETLSIGLLVLHPGSHKKKGLRFGIRQAAKSLDEIIGESETENCLILLENTASQGANLGGDFEELAEIIESSHVAERLGVCIDTCHAFAAGYELSDKEGYENTIRHLAETVGLERVKAWHLNDSKGKKSARVDRHEHIGEGEIGIQGFRNLLNDPRFQALPMVLETPKGKDLKEDKENLALLHSLISN